MPVHRLELTERLRFARSRPAIVWGGAILIAILSIGLWAVKWPEPWRTISQYSQYILLAILLGLIVLLLTRTWRDLRGRLETAERGLAATRQQIATVLRVSHHLVQANDEVEVVDLVLNVCLEVVGAEGASFVPLDERGHPLQAISRGRLPSSGLKEWAEHLATPEVRQICGACQTYHAGQGDTCPLMPGPFREAHQVYCLPLRRGEQDLGVLNLYLAKETSLEAETRDFLLAMVDEMALAIEALRMRQRELATLRQMRALQRSDLESLLSAVLENVARSLEADFAYLAIHSGLQMGSARTMAWGLLPEIARPFLPQVVEQLLISQDPLCLPEQGSPLALPHEIQALIAYPLQSTDGQRIGALLVGNSKPRTFTPQHLTVMRSVAAQLALMTQYTQLVSDLEYQATMSERSRLAREIHDGIAQTLGYLKLMVAQMQGFLDRGDFERLRNAVEDCHTTVTEAYQDARQAIDGLRISPENGLMGWVHQAVEEFQANSSMTVEVTDFDVDARISSEVQAQLIRIVQEALSNIRKHAAAQHVWVSFREWDGDLRLEIRDDGRGFAPEDVLGSSRHGIRGMRERAELIGADFQIQSRPKAGTVVTVRIPLRVGEPG